MELSIILSIIGCITGVTGLLLHFYKFLSERAKIIINFKKSELLFFDKLDSYESYNTTSHCLIYMTTINKSSLPVTIYSIEASCNGKSLYFDKYCSDKLRLLHSINKDGTTSVCIDLANQYHLPLKLEPYSVYQGHLFIAFFIDSSNKTETIDLIIKTSRKIIKKKCIVSKHTTKDNR